MQGYWEWPGLSMGLVVHCERVDKRTGEIREGVGFAITDLPLDTPPETLLKHFRDHWGIENRLHYVLDESMGEDRCRVTSNPGLLSALRKMALSLLQTVKGTRTVKATMRHMWKPRILFQN